MLLTPGPDTTEKSEEARPSGKKRRYSPEFTDDPVESAPVTAAEVASESDNGTNGARRGDPQTLAGELPADGEGPGEQGPSGSGGVRSAGDGGRPAVRTGVGQEDGLPGGVGTGDAGLGIAEEIERGGGRGPPAALPSPVRDNEIREVQISDIAPQAPAPPPRDFRINESHRTGQGGLKEKARDNIAAIRRGNVFETAKVPGSTAWRIRGMLAVRDAIRMVFRTQLDDAPSERITEARSLPHRLQ